MTTDTYTALVDGVDDDAPCSCSDCDWRGRAVLTNDIEDCVLTPGDASPVGRCPACDSLAYIDKPEPDVHKVVKITIDGVDAASAAVSGFVKAGVWFRCSPLPNHKFELCVKSVQDAWHLPSHQNGRGLHQTHFTLSELWSRP
jgi:hypothetical protein